ncbi:ranBP-type and C3HC4-type zinc finger-containing protein 1-like [Malaya genurostris]|uniref:ranBP-type and C3HC4-type zinc finger-containing protein 1-like n=1 Tax=Malaya genurostris TaxID=325434 RepID=UPI0026F3D2F0|nr:ranBP-type and C3HC4-type zinc finger-containing protein 1-like [Malaya genurostris]XP_058452692.1 ranBP-type and C3HC4-type zinc finger-containing protein 1-like [Malaya genurostris]
MDQTDQIIEKMPDDGGEYQRLLQLSNQNIVLNTASTECNLCDKMTISAEGIILINCLHTFCKACLRNSLLQVATVICPYPRGRHECEGVLMDSEIERLLSPHEYNDFHKRVFEAIEQNDTDKSANQMVPLDLDLLVALTDASIVPNSEKFDCPICFETFAEYEGVTLRECFHSFCRECLSNSIKFAEDVSVHCPFRDNETTCEQLIEDREIKSLLNDDDYSTYVGRSLAKVETMAEDAFHCRTPNCNGWCLVEATVETFQCPVCYADNCVRCEAIHPDMDCEEYKDRMSGNYESRRSERVIQNLVSNGEAMHCPSCNITITKNGGCHNMTCSMCRNAFQWTARN